MAQNARLHLGFDRRKPVAAGTEGKVFEKHRQAVEGLDQAHAPHGRPFAVDLEIAGHEILAVDDRKGRCFESVQVFRGKEVAEGRVGLRVARVVLPPHRLAEHQVELARRSQHVLRLRASDQIRVTREARGSLRIGCKNDVVRVNRPYAA